MTSPSDQAAQADQADQADSRGPRGARDPHDRRDARDPRDAFAEVVTATLEATSLTQVLGHVATAARQVLPDASDVSVTLLEGDDARRRRPLRARTVAFTSDLAVDLDERQYESGRGPCLDAALTGRTIEVDMNAPDVLYPEVAARARSRGITHSTSVGLPIAQRTIGALNIYGRRPLDAAELGNAAVFAGLAAVAIANASLVQDSRALVEQMQTAMTTRSVIEQAMGVIMGQQHCSADEAFSALRRRSNDTNVKLRDVAQQVVDGAVDGG